jgi:Glucodextranase, domain B
VTMRRGSRPAQVRPRPASTGRPASPTRPRARTGRISARTTATRRPGTPLYLRLALAVGVVVLGIVVLSAASGAVVRAVGGIGSGLTSAIGRFTSTPVPSATAAIAPNAPALEVPSEPYTNQPTVDISGTVPGSVVGQATVRIRLYVTLAGKEAQSVGEQPVGGSVSFTFPAIALAPGANTFTATLVRGGTESDPSTAVSYVLDKTPPPLTLTAPRNGATVNRDAVAITGRTQARSDIVVRNADSNQTATGVAATDGTFSVSIPLAAGSNEISVTATDPAGNTKSATLTVRRGSGKLTAALSASLYRFSAKKLPDPLTVLVSVADPDGHPMVNATVTFTISIPGVPTVTAQSTTDATGRASFTTTIPRGATVGSGPAAVLVHTDEFGDTTDRTVITIVK